MSIKPSGAPSMGSISPNKIKKFSNNEKNVQACSDPIDCLVVNTDYSFANNGFLAAVHSSFSWHIPLKIDPDDIWLIFLSQVSILVGKNPEKYRNSFVNHSDSKTIEIINDNLILGEDPITSSNKWKYIFPEFELVLNANMKLKMNIAFSTTTLSKYITSEILAMSTMQHYFNFRVMTMCGIPEIRISGTIEDWKLLNSKIEEISTRIFQPEWIPKFSNFIDQAIKVIKGQGNPDYWSQLYYYNSNKGSGASGYTTGLINELFPIDYKGNPAEGLKKSRDPTTFPTTIGELPFIWNYLESHIKCKMKAGLTHAEFDPKKNEISAKATWQIITIE